MYITITARFAGTCRRCQQGFEAGERIRYGGRERTYHLKRDCPAAPAETDSDSTGLVYVEGDNRPFARTRNGLRAGYEHTGVRCEDAPCCGCC